MNILLANSSHFQSGGDWTYIDTITKIYEENGHNVIHFAKQDSRNFPSKFEKFFIEKIDYKEINNNKNLSNALKVFTKSIYSFESQEKLRNLLNEHSVDIAQLNNINNAHTPSIIDVLKDANIPIVWRILDYKLICANRTLLTNGSICEACKNKRFHNSITKKCIHDSYLASIVGMIESVFYSLSGHYRNIDMFSFQSEFTRNKFVEFGLEKSRTQIIENPIHNRYEPSYTNDDYMLYFGRISPEKGIDCLLNAMLKSKNMKLIIIGEGPDSEKSINFVKDNNLQSQIKFVGPKWGNELEDYIRKCKFVILPSIWNDPNPLVIIQSFLFGKPVIGSDIGGISDLIDDGKTGFLFKPKESESLFQHINKLYWNEELIIELGKNAYEIAITKHSPEQYYSKSMELFHNLLSRKN